MFVVVREVSGKNYRLNIMNKEDLKKRFSEEISENFC